MSFHDQLRRRATACAVIAAVHVGLFLLLTAARPEVVRVLLSPPLEVGFIDEPRREPEPWKPPAPELEPVKVVTVLPQSIDIEMASVISDRAITVAPKQTVAPPPAPDVSGNTPKLISAIEYVTPPSPRYPQGSRRQREQGVVILRVLIDSSGHAARIEVHQSSGFTRLDLAAREAVERAEFKPYVENGLAQAAFVLIPIEFSLNSLAVQRS